MKKKKPVDIKSRITVIVAQILITVLVIAFFVAYVLYDSRNGWTSEKIITLSYSFATSTIGIVFYLPLSRYISAQNKDVFHLKLELNKTLDDLLLNKKIINVEVHMINEDNNGFLSDINNIILNRKSDYELVSLDRIDDFFTNQGTLKKPISDLTYYDKVLIKHLFKKIKNNKSDKFDIMYSEYKSGYLVAKPKFPLLEMVLPFVISLVGLFAAIYQILSLNGSLENTLFDYLKVFLVFSLYSCVFALWSGSSGIPYEIKKYKDLIFSVSQIE